MALIGGKILINIGDLKSDSFCVKEVIELNHSNEEGSALNRLKIMMEYYNSQYDFYETNIFNKNGEHMVIYGPLMQGETQEYIDSIGINLLKNEQISNYINYPLNEINYEDIWWEPSYNIIVFFGIEKKDIVKKYLEDCKELDGGNTGLEKKLMKFGIGK